MRTLLMTVCLFLSATLGAQNQVLTDIEQANAAYKTVEGAFTRTQTNAAKGTSDKTEGTLYLRGDDCMAQHYKAPCPDVLIINADDFYMVRGKKTNKFNTAKNKPMRSLRNTLLYCLHGKPAVLAAENGAAITSLITQSVTAILQAWLALKIFKIRFEWKYCLKIVSFIVIVIFISIFAQQLELNWVIKAIITLVLIVLASFFVKIFRIKEIKNLLT